MLSGYRTAAEEFQVLPLAAAAAVGGAAFVDGGVFAAVAQAVRRMQEADAEELAIVWADQPAAVARGEAAFAKQAEALQVVGALAARKCAHLSHSMAANGVACCFGTWWLMLEATHGAGESVRKTVAPTAHAKRHAPRQAILAAAEQPEQGGCAGDRGPAAAPAPAAVDTAAAAAAPAATAGATEAAAPLPSEAAAGSAAVTAAGTAGSRKRKPGSRASRRSLLVQTTKVSILSAREARPFRLPDHCSQRSAVLL
jgi:hypothetical protein